MRTRTTLAMMATLTLTTWLSAQTPENPRPLPPTITGSAPTPAVTPAGGNTVAAEAPIARFLNPRQAFPPETEQAVYSARIGTDWLYRMNQPAGRFWPGLNPAIPQSFVADGDFRQALGSLALCESARFTNDERFLARASGSVLSLLALTKLDGAMRVPSMANERCNRVGFAAVTVLAIYALPQTDAKMQAEAVALTKFLTKQVQASGEITLADDGQKADPEAALVCPGLALQAMSLAIRMKPDIETRDAFQKSIAFYAGQMKSNPSAILVATTMPALVDYCMMANKDANVVKMVYDAADWLLTCQVPRTETIRGQWMCGFRSQPTSQAEPTWESAWCALAMCHAAKLTRQTGDLQRFQKYRHGAVEGLGFLRTLQFTDESAEHFEKNFRSKFVNGGVRLAPSESTLRIDATATSVLAHLAYLQCGTELRLD
jgi:hypothetical protein